MNEYNHHRIIERFAAACGLDDNKKEIFKEASNYTDSSINAKGNYFYYRNYYSITAKGNIIKLNRIDDNGYLFSNNSIENMKRSGDKMTSDKYCLSNWDTDTDEKEFFSSVNGRKKSKQYDILDIDNQSDNVAFLHAMSSVDEDPSKTYNIFVSHLKKCFAEYLFLENEEDALFVLGIALHGIMDSFTPSHTSFQNYYKQSMALHAQGDVIPIKGKFKGNPPRFVEGSESMEEIVLFDPGHYSKENNYAAKQLDKRLKGFDGDENLNHIELEMLKIFLIIGDITSKITNERITVSDGKVDIEKTQNLLNSLQGNDTPLSTINRILSNYKYGDSSYQYSETLINLLKEIYNVLNYGRFRVHQNGDRAYEIYKNIIRKVATDSKPGEINLALQLWSESYERLQNDEYFKSKNELLTKLFKQRDKYSTQLYWDILNGVTTIDYLMMIINNLA